MHSKLIQVYKTVGNDTQLIATLEMLLPNSEYHAFLGTCIQQSPLDIYKSIADCMERRDNESIQKQWDAQKVRITQTHLTRLDFEKSVILESTLDSVLNRILEMDESQDTSRCALISFLFKKLSFSDLKMDLLNSLLLHLDYFTIHNKSNIPILVPILVLELKYESFETMDLDHLESLNTSLDPSVPLQGLIQLILKHVKSQMHLEDVSKLLNLAQDFQEWTWCYYLIALYQEKSSNYPAAIEALQSALKNLMNLESNLGLEFPLRKIAIHTLLAKCLLEQGETHVSDALTHYQSALGLDPNHQESLLGMGRIQLKLKKFNQAKTIFGKVLAQNASNHSALSEIGWTAYLCQEYQDALEYTQKALAIKQDYLYFYRLGRIYWALGEQYRIDKEVCLNYFLKSAKSNPTFAPSFSCLGDYYYQIELDVERGLKCYQKAVQLDSFYQEAVQSLIRIYLFRDRIVEAEKLLIHSCESDPRNAWAHKELGLLLVKKQNYREAIHHFQDSLRVSEKDFVVWECLCQCFAHEGKYIASLKAIQRAIEYAHDKNSSYFLQGQIQLKLGMYLQAIDSFNHVLESKPQHLPSLKDKIEAYMAYGKELYVQGSFERSAQQFINGIQVAQTALEISSELHFIFKLMGDCFLKIVLHVPGRVEAVRADQVEFCKSFLPKCREKLGFFVSPIVKHLAESNTQSTREKINLSHVLECALICYSMAAITCGNPNLLSFYYYDASLVVYKTYSLLDSSIDLELAVKAAKLGLNYSSQSHLVWNGLGVYLSLLNPLYSQHAFIQALQVQPKPSYWSNLGYFYLKHGDLELAKECFCQSQLLDSEWPSSWLGKALVARSTPQKWDEYQELIQHGQELTCGTWMEWNYLYCEALVQSKLKNDMNMSSKEYYTSKGYQDALAKASLYLRQSKNHYITNPRVWNLIGIILERVQDYQESCNAFQKGLDSCDSCNSIHTMLQSNYARVLYFLKACDESSLAFKQVNHPTSQDKIYQALVYHHLSDLPSLLECFESSIALAGQDIYLINKSLVYLAKVLYSCKVENNLQLARQQFFQCVTNDMSNAEALYGLLTLSLIDSNVDLGSNVCIELLNIQSLLPNPQDKAEMYYVLSCFSLYYGNVKSARAYLCKALHVCPFNLEGWNRLLDFDLSLSTRYFFVSQESISSLMTSSNDMQKPKRHMTSITRQNMSSFISFIQRNYVLKDSSTSWSLLGLQLISDGSTASQVELIQRVKQAQSAFQRAVRLVPTDYKPWIYLGISQLSLCILKLYYKDFDEYERCTLQDAMTCLSKILNQTRRLLNSTESDSCIIKQEYTTTFYDLMAYHDYIQHQRDVNSLILSSETPTSTRRWIEFNQLIRLDVSNPQLKLPMYTDLIKDPKKLECIFASFKDLKSLQTSCSLFTLSRLALEYLKQELHSELSSVLREIQELYPNQMGLIKFFNYLVFVMTGNKVKADKIVLEPFYDSLKNRKF